MPERPAVPKAFRLGDRGPEVAVIRHRLVLLGILGAPRPGGEQPAETADPTAFDGELRAAVRAFQQQQGLMADGVVGPQTWRRIDDARWQLGDRVLRFTPGHLLGGDDVAELQRRLLDLGFDTGRVDGTFGPQTERALREFQRNVGVEADGTCGPVTFKALGRLSRTVVGGAPQGLWEAERLRRAGPGLGGKVVVLDPGHGGADRGVQAGQVDEAGLVEDLASRIEGRLTALGVTTYLTRGRLSAETDPPDDAARAQFANSTGADLLVSLHVDSAADPRPHGVATYYYGAGPHGAHSAVGESLATLVQREVVARTDLLDCRTHGKAWDLLRRTRMPAVRVELGYLSNPGDAGRLADPSFRDAVAEGVVAAVNRLFHALGPEGPAEVVELTGLATSV